MAPAHTLQLTHVGALLPDGQRLQGQSRRVLSCWEAVQVLLLGLLGACEGQPLTAGDRLCKQESSWAGPASVIVTDGSIVKKLGRN
jgi:hypothetical protein